MKTYILILISLFAALNVFPQSDLSDSLKIDSLKKVLRIQKEDTNKVNTLNTLCRNLKDKADFMQYANEQLSLCEKLNFRRGKAAAYLNIADAFYQQGNYSECLKNSYSALGLFEEFHNKENMAQTLQFVGSIFMIEENYSEALKNIQRALKVREEIKDSNGIAQSLNTLGSIYLSKGDYTEALQKHFAALKICEELGDRAKNWSIPFCYRCIGDAYQKQGEIASATGDKVNSVNNYSAALKFYLLTLQKWKKIGRKDAIAESYNSLGDIYTKLKNISKAKDYLEKGLRLSVESRNKVTVMFIYASLSILDSVRGNYKQAFKDYKMYILYRDSLVNEENSKKILQSKMQYEFDKKEAATKAAQDKKDEDAMLTRNLQYYALAFFLLLALSLYIYSRQKQKAKAKIEKAYSVLKSTQAKLIEAEKIASLEKSQQAVLNERLRISHELHDEVGATLSSISIFSQAAIQKNECGNLADSKNILQRIGETSREVMGELNDTVWLINPLNDNLQKIIQRISNYALPLCRTNNIRFEIKAAAAVENLDLNVDKRKAIYLIIKEAVNNSLKYAVAKNLIIQFDKNRNALRVSIQDDGSGFAENNLSTGNGLNNMKQRAKDVKGKIDFISAQQKGTEIVLKIPLTNIGD